jgi:hypothetical protein
MHQGLKSRSVATPLVALNGGSLDTQKAHSVLSTKIQFKTKAFLVSIIFNNSLNAKQTQKTLRSVQQNAPKKQKRRSDSIQKFGELGYKWLKYHEQKPMVSPLSSGTWTIIFHLHLYIIKGENLVKSILRERGLGPYPMETACSGCANRNTPATSIDLDLSEAHQTLDNPNSSL